MQNTKTTTEATEAVAVAVRVELARRRMSQVDLAALLGVAPQYLNRRMTGAVAMSVDDLRAIADALGVQPGELLDAEPAAA